jgi:hypothetical protein
VFAHYSDGSVKELKQTNSSTPGADEFYIDINNNSISFGSTPAEVIVIYTNYLEIQTGSPLSFTDSTGLLTIPLNVDSKTLADQINNSPNNSIPFYAVVGSVDTNPTLSDLLSSGQVFTYPKDDLVSAWYCFSQRTRNNSITIKYQWSSIVLSADKFLRLPRIRPIDSDQLAKLALPTWLYITPKIQSSAVSLSIVDQEVRNVISFSTSESFGVVTLVGNPKLRTASIADVPGYAAIVKKDRTSNIVQGPPYSRDTIHMFVTGNVRSKR